MSTIKSCGVWVMDSSSDPSFYHITHSTDAHKDACIGLHKAAMIYCCMWCDNHWFLVVIDLVQNQLVYLDSLRSPTAQSKRRHQIRKLEIFLDDLLDDRAWYANANTDKVECSEFEITEPKLVTDYSRMGLAIDMVLKYHNDNKIKAALKYWEFFSRSMIATLEAYLPEEITSFV
ncbi:hypothetical protein Ahy_B10g105043 [Arachis hypogaea]|uniref:Ubiquitin-like protease family profile domain-containing protein n=1 Tax=Arachis hypogaea TaxID=3818 RepID=A0A444X733_ARAHY|nr:hypothetical protein Ahy_B10g105043 [Arachis hypogaea]